MKKFKNYSNEALVKELRDISASYEVLGENFFKVRAYKMAADAIEQASIEVKDMWDDNTLGTIPGLGRSIREHIEEFFKTGKVKHFEEVKKKLPPGMFVLLDVPGIGPKTAYKLARELGIEKKSDLIKACRKGLVASLPGFGEKSQEEILRSLLKKDVKKGRILLPTAEKIAKKYIEYLLTFDFINKAEALGSLRRKCATVGDVDIIVSTTSPNKSLQAFAEYPGVSRIIDKGEKKGSVRLKGGQRVDLMVCGESSYGSLLQHFTGSKMHNIALRKLAQKKGMSVSEYGVKNGKGKLSKFTTEEGLYEYLGMSWIPPELREDRGEISLALKGRLPNLVEINDLKGDLHIHTQYSDGLCTIKEMHKACIGKKYEYMAITDHSPSIIRRGRRGVLRIIREQRDIIDKINYSNRAVKVFLGTECNILSSGDMALPDDILEKYDFVIGAIHTAFNQPKEVITKRLLNAIKNPLVTFIAHPSGRLLNIREPYNVDWDIVFEYAHKYDKPLEINSFPARLDLSDILIKKAKDAGVGFIINTDSHNIEHLDNMKYGVSVARRGWCQPKNIVNTLSLKEFVKKLRIRNQP